MSEVQPHEVEIMRQRRADIMVRLDALLADNAVFVLPTVPDLAPLLRLRPADPVAFRERALALMRGRLVRRGSSRAGRPRPGLRAGDSVVGWGIMAAA